MSRFKLKAADVAAALLATGSAVMTLWQGRRQAVLWDLSYPLNYAFRIVSGWLPYRDYPFVHAPGTFLIQAILLRLFGRSYGVPLTYAASISFLGTVLTIAIVRQILKRESPSYRFFANAFCLPLVPLAVYGVYPHPFYD